MLRGRKKLKTTAGLTLVELLVTMMILMIIIAPIMGMFIAGSRTTMASNNLSAASLTAQLRMEELVGLTRKELCDDFGAAADAAVIRWDDNDYNGFYVEAVIEFDYEAPATSGGTVVAYGQIAEVTVIVKDSEDGDELFRQTNILNVA